jgi:hypothetical protein
VSDLERSEAIVAAALQGADPRAAFAAAARDETLSPELRAGFAAASSDGVRIAGLLVAKLRFERLMHGSRAAAEWFDRDPAAFAGAFRRYHAEVAQTAEGPHQEGAAFEAWSRRNEGARATDT